MLVRHKTFRESRLLKYLINEELITFSNKIQAKTFTWPDMSFLCSTANIDAPNKGIEQACSWSSCDIHISHLVSIYTLTFSNVLLVLVLNLMVHKSSYCKYSLA